MRSGESVTSSRFVLTKRAVTPRIMHGVTSTKIITKTHLLTLTEIVITKTNIMVTNIITRINIMMKSLVTMKSTELNMINLTINTASIMITIDMAKSLKSQPQSSSMKSCTRFRKLTRIMLRLTRGRSGPGVHRETNMTLSGHLQYQN